MIRDGKLALQSPAFSEELMRNSRYRVEQQASRPRDRARSIALPCLLLFLALSWTACRSDSTGNGSPPVVNTAPSPSASPSPATQPPAGFDGARAFEHIRKQVEI